MTRPSLYFDGHEIKAPSCRYESLFALHCAWILVYTKVTGFDDLTFFNRYYDDGIVFW